MTEFIRTAPESFFLAAVITAAGLILAALYFFWRGLRHSRLMEDMPTSRIRSAAQGYVELEGRGQMMKGDPILAPLSRQPCVWWQYKITETRRDRGRLGDSGYRTRVIDRGSSDAIFLLHDGTGECIVDPHGAQILHSRRHKWHGNKPWPAAGPRRSTFALFSRYHYEERLIRVGDPVYAIGQFRTQRAAAGHLDHSAELNALLREWKQDEELLHQRFDVNRDGRIDATEWEAARRVALKQLRRDLLEQELPPGLHVLSHPTDGRPYVISGIPQAKLIARNRLFTIAALIVFLGLIGFVVRAFQVRI